MDVLKQLKKINPDRCQKAFGYEIDQWSHTDWATAVGGECGELLNLVKKHRRGDQINLEDIGREAADIVIYLDLLCQRYGIDLSSAIVNKFNETSDKMGFDKKLYYY